MRTLRLHLGKFVITVYRWVAVLVLYGVLFGVLSYIGITGFFAVSSSWIAPFRVTPTTDKILDMSAKLVESQQTLNALINDRDKLQGSLNDLTRTKASLDALDENFQHAIVIEKRENQVDRPALDALNAQKRRDNADTKAVLQQVTQVESQIDQDLAAGLITKGDAAIQKSQFRETKNLYTDGRIAEVLLRDNIRQKSSDDTTAVDELAKDAELRMNIAQLSISISSGEEQLISDKGQIAQLENAIATAQHSPYYLATQGGVQFAFVSYDNEVAKGAGVYSCLFSMLVCHRVGVIKAVFNDEETAVHPIYKTPLRGHLVQLGLTEPEAAKHMVLFVGRKPLLF